MHLNYKKQENLDLKMEITKLKSYIKEQQTKASEYKDELEKERTKNIYTNLDKIENETLKRQIKEMEKKHEEMIETELEKESKHKKEIEVLKNKIKIYNLDKIKTRKPEQEQAMETDNESDTKYITCNGCDYKSIWKTNTDEHKKKCKKN